jgi:hypothetical protein
MEGLDLMCYCTEFGASCREVRYLTNTPRALLKYLTSTIAAKLVCIYVLKLISMPSASEPLRLIPGHVTLWQ